MATHASTGGTEVVRVDARELNDLIKRLRQVENKKLKARLRKALKDSAKPMVDAVQKKVLEDAPSGGARRSGGRIRYTKSRSRTVKGVDFDGSVIRERVTEQVSMRRTVRQGIAKGIGASLRASGNDAQLIITASPRFLGNRAPMLKAYNKRSFRHPLFGNRNYWHTQQGNPYFGDTIYNNRDEVVKRLAAAMEAVANDITG